jgi:amidase
MERFPAEHDATALADCIRSGKTNAVRVMDAALQRAAERHDLGAVRFHDAALGAAGAEAVDHDLARRIPERSAQSFAGVPLLMKDLGAVTRGLPTVAGSAAIVRRSGPSPHDSDVTKRLRSLGLVPFGTTTVSEFGMALSSEPAIGPIARNPTDPRHTPGGSSGGAAAAVASGIVAIAHATDAAGSTRVPAACCGLVGLKTSRGAIPSGPDFNNSLSGLVSEFVVTRSLRDASTALQALAGCARGPFPDPYLVGADEFSKPPDPLRIGVIADSGMEIESARAAAIGNAAGVLARSGHTIVPVDPERLRPLTTAALRIVIDIVCASLARWLSQLDPILDRSEIEPLCFASYQRGRAMSAVDLSGAELAAARVAHGVWTLFDDVDVLLLPMLSAQPPQIGAFPLDHEDIDLHWKRMNKFAPFAALANVAGVPALSIPHGIDGYGFSTPVQLWGPMGTDNLLLRIANTLQCAEPWVYAHPIAGLPLHDGIRKIS